MGSDNGTLCPFAWLVGICVYVCMHMHVVGSISGSHFAPYWVNSWAAKAQKTNTKTTTKMQQTRWVQMDSFSHKSSKKTSFLKQKFWVNDWATVALKCWSKMWPSYWPFGGPIENTQKTKTHKFQIWKHNCPLWVYPEVVPRRLPFTPPPFFICFCFSAFANKNT